MTNDPFDELVADDPVLEVVDIAVAMWESIPLWVWILVAFFVVKVISDRSSSRRRERTAERDSEASWGSAPSREEYSIHDDIDDSRDYRPPSESDPIVTTNEVDRSLLGKLKRLARIGQASSRDR